MNIQSRFIKEGSEYFLIDPNAKTPIPEKHFKLFYDTIIDKLKENNCLTEIKQEIIETCKQKTGKKFNKVEETVNLLFDLTIQLRRNITEKTPDNYTFADFDSCYKLMLLQHELPNPEHEIFDTAIVLNYLGDNVFPNNTQPTAIDLWKQQNRNIANIGVVLKHTRDSQEKLILQQIIQHFLQIEMKEQKRIDSNMVTIKTCNHIRNYDFLNNLPNVVDCIARRITETKKIMFPSLTPNRGHEIGSVENQVLGKRELEAAQAASPDRGNKRAHLVPIHLNNQPIAQPVNRTFSPVAVVPTHSKSAHLNRNRNNNNNIARANVVVPDVNEFLNTNLKDLKDRDLSDGKQSLYWKFKNEGGTLCDTVFSAKLREKFTEVLNSEFDTIYKHLKEIQPVITRFAHKELDVLLQKMVQWEISQGPNRTHVEISEDIWNKMEESSLPFREAFSKNTIQRRILETKRLLAETNK